MVVKIRRMIKCQKSGNRGTVCHCHSMMCKDRLLLAVTVALLHIWVILEILSWDLLRLRFSFWNIWWMYAVTWNSDCHWACNIAEQHNNWRSVWEQDVGRREGHSKTLVVSLERYEGVRPHRGVVDADWNCPCPCQPVTSAPLVHTHSATTKSKRPRTGTGGKETCHNRCSCHDDSDTNSRQWYRRFTTSTSITFSAKVRFCFCHVILLFLPATCYRLMKVI